MKLTDEQQALADVMGGISERIWCAGWLTGLEYHLWEWLVGDGSWAKRGRVTEGERRVLRVLSDLVGGWIRFDDDNGETFVPMAEWKARFAEWVK